MAHYWGLAEHLALASVISTPARILGLAPITSLSIVLFWSFGMGSVLLIWLLTHRTYPSHPTSTIENQYSAYFVVDEGNKTGSMKMLNGEDSLESTMRGVLIITAIVCDTGHFLISTDYVTADGLHCLVSHWRRCSAHRASGR